MLRYYVQSGQPGSSCRSVAYRKRTARKLPAKCEFLGRKLPVSRNETGGSLPRNFL